MAGLALEALAFKIMRLLDMKFVATRLRASQTGGAEVDLVFESARLVFSRWQIQCKNTARVSLDDIAKEVGLTHFLKSNAVVVVTTGEVGTEARRYANRIMADTNLAIVLLDGRDLASISTNPARIVRAFEREARHAMNLKKLDTKGQPRGENGMTDGEPTAWLQTQLGRIFHDDSLTIMEACDDAFHGHDSDKPAFRPHAKKGLRQ